MNNAIVLNKTWIAAKLSLLLLRVDPAFKFNAGQFVVVPLPPDPHAEAGLKAPKGFYSIASAEQRKGEIELLIEAKDGYASQWMSTRRGGDQLTLEGPLGKFGLSQSTLPKIFATSKAGIAPLRSMILSLLKAGSGVPVQLYLGGAERPFHAEWHALAMAHKNFTYYPCLDLAAEIQAQATDRGAEIYAAGFNAELMPLLAALEAAGYDKNLIKSEKFG
jgi:ferredoxin-NADP reductase